MKMRGLSPSAWANYKNLESLHNRQNAPRGPPRKYNPVSVYGPKVVKNPKTGTSYIQGMPPGVIQKGYYDE
jgi:hypothetical protein